MSVHYKFKSALSFDTITFDGLHISVRDLKKAILQQKQIGKATDFDLQITNAQSNEVYDDENVLIPKNSSLIVVRVPLTAQQKKNWEKSDTLPSLNAKGINSETQDPVVNRLAKTVDLANVDASEGDKIQAAITQSTLDYDPSNYLRIKGSNQVGELPANYRCYKCFQPGHWIKDCKLNAQQDAIEIKKSTGIPRSFMVPVEGPEVPGAMMTPTGQFAVPSIEHEARREPIRKAKEPAVMEKPTIPEDLLCGVCKDLLNDAVLIPCCGNSFCDECIRNFLLESEEHQCPDCNEKDVSPDTLIPNRFLRNSVNNFKNQTGYMRSVPVKQAHPPLVPAQPSTLIPVHVVDELPPPKRSPPPMTPASPDNKEEPTVSPDEIVIVNEVEAEPAAPASPLGNAIPALQTDPVYPHHPIHLIPSRLPPNPNVCPKGEDMPHHIKDKPGGYLNKGRSRHSTRKQERSDHWRADRSGTPTVDERNNDRYQSINVHVSQPGMTQPLHHVNQAPMSNTNNQHNSTRGPHPIYPRGGGGNYMYGGRQPHYVNRGGRAPPMPYTYPPGGGPPHLRGAPPFRGRPRAPYNRNHSPNNNTTIPTGPIDDPVEIFERLMIEKDLRLNQRRAQRQSHSRSPFSRSRSRSPRSPRRPRSRSRSRSRTRTSTRTRSHSRSPVRRRRSRSRSQFSLSRSSSRSIRSRSQVSRSPSRDRRDYSPRRRADYRSPLRPASPPTRYYSQRYKEEQFNSLHANRNGRGRFIPKSQEYYTQDYPRENERYDRLPGRDRDRERMDRDRADKGDRFDRIDRVERPDRTERVESRVERPDRLERLDRPDRLERGDRLDRNERLDRDRERDRDRVERDRERGDRDRERMDRERERDREARPERERPDRGDRSEKDRGFERIDRERIDRERLDTRDRGIEKDRDREREREKDRERERDRNYSSYKRYDTFETMRDYEHPTREIIVRDWEKTRDREIEMREKEKQAEYYRKREQRGNPVEIIETSREPSAPPGVNEEERDRVLIDLPVRSEPLEKPPRSPDKEKKPKEKKKKKKEDSERKKKKKKLKEKTDKKEALEEGEIAPDKPEPAEIPVLEEPTKDELYGDLGANIDQFVVQNYNKPVEEKKEPVVEKDVMLAPVPELSKWEKEEEILNQVEENKRASDSDNKQVTSEILERAMNVIIKKSVKPIEKKVEKKPDVRENRENRERRSRERDKEKRDEKREEPERHSNKDAPKSVALPVKTEYEKKRSSSKSRLPSHTSKPGSSVRISAKERLGAKIEDKVVVKRDVRGDRREIKILEKIPKSVVRRERENTPERSKSTASNSSRDYKKPENKHIEPKPAEEPVFPPDLKKPPLDETIFEPDYEKSDHENEEKKNQVAGEVKKRSCSVEKGPEPKKTKVDIESKISSEDSSASSDDSSRSHKKKKKKKHKKKKSKKKRHDSSSDSDSSDSSSPSESERKKKKHKHKSHKKSKKRKKSKK